MLIRQLIGLRMPRWVPALAVLLVGHQARTWGAEPPIAAARAPYVRTTPAVGSARNEDGGKRLREGTQLIDLEGRFDSNGDRWIFFRADTDESYKVLENLALERIHKVMEETRASEKPRWVISGTVTEYLGSNYLLVTKAVIKAQSADPTPRASGSSVPKAETPPAAAEGRGQVP